MSPIVFLPGFDGVAALREDFLGRLRGGFEVRAVTYPNRRLGSLDGYLQHAMAQAPVDWRPVVVAESFSGLVAARWAAIDPRVEALVLCGAFARNPMGLLTHWGASLPGVVRWGPTLLPPTASASPLRERWARGFRSALRGLAADVVAERLELIATEDAGPSLAALAIPVVLVQFQGDEAIRKPARDHLEAVCHNAQVLRLPGPHFAIESRPGDCAAAIAEVLNELHPARA